MLLDKPGVIPLTLQRKGVSYPLFLSLIHKESPLELEDSCYLWLNQEEMDILDEITSPKKRASFLLGRYAAKMGVSCFLNQSDMLGASVLKGALGQPVVQCPQWNAPEVSLAHSSSWAAALIYPAGQQLGVDLEVLNYRESRLHTLESRLTSKEHELLTTIKLPWERVKALYVLWSMKEALSKVLRCGLTLPFQALELNQLQWKGSYLEGRFSHFTQYRVVAEASEKMSLALVLPWKSSIFLAGGELL